MLVRFTNAAFGREAAADISEGKTFFCFHMSSGENTFIMFDCNAIVDISWRHWKYMAAVQGSTCT